MTPEKRTASSLVRLLKQAGRLRQMSQTAFDTEARKLFDAHPSVCLNWDHPAYPMYLREALPAGTTVKTVKNLNLAQAVGEERNWYRIGRIREITYVVGWKEKREYWLSLDQGDERLLVHREDLRSPHLPDMASIVRLLDPESWFMNQKAEKGPIHDMVVVAKRVEAERKWNEKIQEVYGLNPEQQAVVASLVQRHQLLFSWYRRIRIVCHHVSALISGLPQEKYPKLFWLHGYGAEKRQLTVRIDGETFFWDRSGHVVWEQESQDVNVAGDERAVYRYENWYPLCKIDKGGRKKKTRREKRIEEEWQNLRKKAKTEDIRASKIRSSRKETERKTLLRLEKAREERPRVEEQND